MTAGFGFAGPPQTSAFRNGYSSSLSGIVAGGGVAVDLGVELGDAAAVYVRGEGSGFGAPPFASDAAVYLVGEWTPRHWLSVASGLGYELMAPPAMCNGFGGCGTDYPHWTGLSVPLILVFNVLQVRLPDGVHRAAVRIGLEGAAGLSPSTDAYDWHATATLGVALM
jgi:hypothetical protein